MYIFTIIKIVYYNVYLSRGYRFRLTRHCQAPPLLFFFKECKGAWQHDLRLHGLEQRLPFSQDHWLRLLLCFVAGVPHDAALSGGG